MEALREAHDCVDEWTAESASLTTETEQAKAEREKLTALILELEAAAATHEGELGVVGQAVRYLKGHVAVGEDIANTAQALARRTLDKTSKIRAPVEGLNWTVIGKHACVAGLVNAGLVHVWSAISEPFSESEGTVSGAIGDVVNGLLLESLSDTPGPSARGLYDQA